jgi:C4-type Zn-finger protein
MTDRLTFRLTCPLCAGELHPDPDVTPARPTVRLSSLALVCSACGTRHQAIVSLITEDDR